MLECGLFLDKMHPYIGASPDRMVTCDCCPKACVEVKCPYSTNYTSPTDPAVNLSYLKNMNGILKVKDTHKYYTQFQMQMGATGCTSYYFFVWTEYGFILDKILFDKDFWDKLKHSFHIFMNCT